jgi:transposase
VLHLSASCHYYLYSSPVHIRKSFDGLSGIVQNELKKDLLSAAVFIFLNRCRNQVKLLLHEADGFTLFYRRLHKGRFTLPSALPQEGSIRLSTTDLLSMLQGLHLHRSEKRA